MCESDETKHVPILTEEILKAFTWEEKQDGKFSTRLVLDGTLGGGGHSEALLRHDPELYLIALDRDLSAIKRATRRLARFADRVAFSQRNFSNLETLYQDVESHIPEIFRRAPLRFDGILLDLGISSDQLDDPGRGFSYAATGDLDMRMDRGQTLTADTVLNSYSEAELLRVFRTGGMKGEASALVRAIQEDRPIHSTEKFRALCESVLTPIMRKRARRGEIERVKNPALVPFQAVRIEVNQELKSLQGFLDQVPQFLKPNGRLAILSFHSLEDELVTRTMRRWSQRGVVKRGLPSEAEPLGALLTKKAIQPSVTEIERNSRAHSARLRVFERH